MIGEVLLIILSFSLILLGAIGVIFPFLPGVVLGWPGILSFGFVNNSFFIDAKMISIFLGFTLLTLILDLAVPAIGAKKYDASRYGIAGSFLGLLFGVSLFGPFGIVIGPFVGALAGEMIKGRDPEEAMQSAKGTLIGFLAGSAIKLSLILVMLGFLIFAIYKIIF